MRLLLIEDEPKLAAFIERGLIEETFDVDVVQRGEEALERLGRAAYDLVVLDLALPGIDGLAVCRAIRAQGIDVPILILSARGLVEDRVKGLDLGADDYLMKPFAFSELVARVRALLRRRQPTGLLALSVHDLTLDPLTRTAARGPRRLDLTQKEFALLEYLLRHAGQPVSRTMISEHVWGFNWDRMTNVIDVYINRLRKKLELSGESRLLYAVRGTGYTIRAPDGSE